MLGELEYIGEPYYSEKEKKFKTSLKAEDELRIAFIRGCLQTLLALKYDEKEENETITK